MRVTGAEGEALGIISLDEAKQIAYAADLDLVEISPNADPPVCKIMNYGKYQFELNKKLQIAKKKQKQIQVKEIKFRPGTDEGDYQVKLRSLIKFLNDGDKTKITVRYRGREMAHREIGMDSVEAYRNRFGRTGYSRAVSENGRPANDYGDVTEKEKIGTTSSSFPRSGVGFIL